MAVVGSIAIEQVHRTLSDPAFGNDMLSVLNDMRAEGDLLDVTVVAGEEEFRAHSTVLACGSDYFRGLFSSGMKESREKRVDLKDPSVTAEAFRLLLEFLYTGQLVVCSENVYDVLAVANHLQVNTSRSVSSLSWSTERRRRETSAAGASFLGGSGAADLYSLKTLQESLDTVIAEDFMEVTSSDDFLEPATKDELIRLLQLENLAVPSEQQVYEAVMRWLTHHTSRMEHAAAVLSHVQLALLDVDVLHAHLETDFGATQECRHLIMEAMAYHGLSPETRRSLNWPRSTPRTQMKSLLALSWESRIFTTKGWIRNQDIVPSLDGSDVITAAVAGNVLYMLFSSSSSSRFKSYDPATNAVNTLSSPDDGYHPSIIGDAQMVAVGARLFLVCGCQKKAWCFDTTVGRWTEIPPVGENRGGVALASCQGAVLAIGGIHRQYLMGVTSMDPSQYTDTPMSRVQAYLPGKKSWETVSSTTQPHAGATALVQGDTVYIGGGVTRVNGDTVDNTTVEMCRVFVKDDVAVSAWSVVPQPPCVHRFASKVAVIDRKAYFILGGQMHFTGKFVDHDRTSEEDVEDMCRAFRKDVQSGNVVCAILSLKEKQYHSTYVE
ncbi:kelch-like protein 17 [Branchiostoma lanceolatum]|uniref:kelch-like protein 17 n=1 Tax=Branchiostoma lanceolatum TaxID=7740 RepID=UPI0034548C65